MFTVKATINNKEYTKSYPVWMAAFMYASELAQAYRRKSWDTPAPTVNIKIEDSRRDDVAATYTHDTGWKFTN